MRLKSFVLLALAVCCAAVAVVAQDGGGAPAVSQGASVSTASSSGAPSGEGVGIKKYLLGPGDVLTKLARRALPDAGAHAVGSPDAESAALEEIHRAEELLAFSLPRYEREGKSYLTIAIGCTGGLHRSVVVTATLAERLREKTGLPIVVLHRDVGRADIFGTRPPPALSLGGVEGEEK